MSQSALSSRLLYPLSPEARCWGGQHLALPPPSKSPVPSGWGAPLCLAGLGGREELSPSSPSHLPPP